MKYTIIHHFTLDDGTQVKRLEDGQQATMVCSMVDQQGRPYESRPDDIAPCEQSVRVWRSTHGLLFHSLAFMSAMGLTHLRFKLERDIDMESMRKDVKPCVDNHLYLRLIDAVKLAGTADLLNGFLPLAELLLQPAFAGHVARVSTVVPSAMGKEPVPEEELPVDNMTDAEIDELLRSI